MGRDRSSRAAQPSLLELQYMEQQQLLEKQRQQQRRRAMQRREYDRRQQVADQSLKWHRPHSAECRRDGYSRRFFFANDWICTAPIVANLPPRCFLTGAPTYELARKFCSTLVK